LKNKKGGLFVDTVYRRETVSGLESLLTSVGGQAAVIYISTCQVGLLA